MDSGIHEDDLLSMLAKLIEDMAMDYDRFSASGKETYNEICSVVNKLLGN